jgi:tetratricopeptide (TPR) repeat protein
MRGRHLLLVAASLVAVALLLAPKRSSRVDEPEPVPPAAKALTPAPPSTPPRGDARQANTREPAAADGEALREEADRLIGEGKVVEGLDVFRKAVEADPSAKNHGDLGRILYRLMAFDEAAVHLRAAAELDPGNADRWIALANLYYRKVDLGEAWKAEKRAREAEPGLELGRDSEGMRVRKGDSAPPTP